MRNHHAGRMKWGVNSRSRNAIYSIAAYARITWARGRFNHYYLSSGMGRACCMAASTDCLICCCICCICCDCSRTVAAGALAGTPLEIAPGGSQRRHSLPGRGQFRFAQPPHGAQHQHQRENAEDRPHFSCLQQLLHPSRYPACPSTAPVPARSRRLARTAPASPRALPADAG